MDVQKRHSIIERIQEQSSFTVFQPTFFSSSFEPESLEDFDFESAPMHRLPTTKEDDEQDPIHQSSGLTSNSNVTSYASTAPILQQQHHQPYSKHDQTLTTATEEYSLRTMDTKRNSVNDATTTGSDAGSAEAGADDSQETLNSKHVSLQQQQQQQPRYVLKNQPYRNYQIFPGHTRFLLGGRLVTSRDYRAFVAALFILISPTVLFAIFTYVPNVRLIPMISYLSLFICFCGFFIDVHSYGTRFIQLCPSCLLISLCLRLSQC